MKVPGFFGWMFAAYRTTTQEVMDKAGLDHAMLIEFAKLSMRILIVIGGPLVFVLGPLHLFCGGGAAGEDKLSWMSMGNVEQGSWLCWVHAFVVWYVVIATHKLIFRSMRREFIPRRFKFLKDMPEPRATSVMVEDVPDRLCKEQVLRNYFDENVFGRKVVKHLYFVKQTADLHKMQHNLNKAKDMGVRARLAGTTDPEKLQRMEKLEREVEKEVDRLRKEINDSDELNSRNAFITFKTRRDTVIALKLFSPADEEEIVVTIPPDPSDIIWADMLVDPNLQTFKELVGYGLTAALMIFFMPIVLTIARIASLDNIKDTVPFADDLVHSYPKLATLYNGLVGSLSLSFMMSMLPTFLVLIFSACFVLREGAKLQQLVQVSYFYFLVLYVLLVTAIGSDLLGTGLQIVERPLKVFALLADKMPTRTHFYLSYITVQWGTHAMNLTRYMNLLKFAAFGLVYDKKAAKDLAEPEDQDYYGVGSRSARFALLLVICLVFCTLTPLMTVVGFVNFFLSRLFYSYLFVYSESVKADLGGVFWFESLKHVQMGLFIYIVLMTGVLFERAASPYPAFIAVSCLLYSVSELRYFLREFRWELLELHEVKSDASKVLPGVCYKQPELISQLDPEEPQRQASPPSPPPSQPPSAPDIGTMLQQAACGCVPPVQRTPAFQALQTRLGLGAASPTATAATAAVPRAPANTPRETVL
uniref:CSC1/OSCA1-like 7TM region domain-containing protein n=1 Tax=Pyrodinium bahamense TaxID=73915 RepID=A0A7S0FKA8_9DINO